MKKNHCDEDIFELCSNISPSQWFFIVTLNSGQAWIVDKSLCFYKRDLSVQWKPRNVVLENDGNQDNSTGPGVGAI